MFQHILTRFCNIILTKKKKNVGVRCHCGQFAIEIVDTVFSNFLYFSIIVNLRLFINKRCIASRQVKE